MNFGNNPITNVKVGTATIAKVMYASEVIWENITFIENMTYNDTNIAAEFIILDGIDTTGNILTADSADGTAIAQSITSIEQLVGIASVAGQNVFEADFSFTNVSDISSIADTLTTFSPIQDGDNLVIVKDDDSIHQMVASGTVSSSIVDSTDPFGDGSLLAKYRLDGDILSLTGAYDGFDGVNVNYSPAVFGDGLQCDGASTRFLIDRALLNRATFTISVHLKNFQATDDAMIIGAATATNGQATQLYVTATGQVTFRFWHTDRWRTTATTPAGSLVVGEDYHIIAQFNAQGTDVWVDEILLASDTGNRTPTAHTYDFGVGYRNNDGWYYESIIDQIEVYNKVLTDEEKTALRYQTKGTNMDTSVITQGEIPSRVYTVDAKAEFSVSGDFIEAHVDVNSYVYTDTLYTTRKYRDVIDNIGSTTISPRVTLKSVGDKMTRLIGSVVS